MSKPRSRQQSAQTASGSTCLPPEPEAGCALCPRLAAFRATNAETFPDWYNGAVTSFGSDDAKFLIVGLAPGLRGANQTGRPFTGDYAGDLLYATLGDFGWSEGTYKAHADDGLALRRCMITNAVRCVPPQNKPTTQEIRTCGGYLRARIKALPDLRVILALGRVAHDAVLTNYGLKKSAFGFAHGARHLLPDDIVLIDSFHCSRYNTNTGRLTVAMFRSVFEAIATEFD